MQDEWYIHKKVFIINDDTFIMGALCWDYNIIISFFQCQIMG